MLTALLRHEVDLSYSCKTGVCQTCMLRASKGEVPAYSQEGIKKTLRAQNYFLSCLCKVEHDMEVTSPNDADLFSSATVRSKQLLTADICSVQLEIATPLFYHAGQFINLRKGRRLLRSYSLASLPQQDDYLEIHVRRLKNGKMSNWILDEMQVGDDIDIEGPMGHCFYAPESIEQNLLLIGTGTGLSPLLGITRDAIYHGHKGEIHLYHGSHLEDGLYNQQRLLEMQKNIVNFYYHPCVSGAVQQSDYASGRACDVALKDHSKLQNWSVYLCGAPPMVNATKKLAYLSGARLEDIHADPFQLTDLRSQKREK